MIGPQHNRFGNSEDNVIQNLVPLAGNVARTVWRSPIGRRVTLMAAGKVAGSLTRNAGVAGAGGQTGSFDNQGNWVVTSGP